MIEASLRAAKTNNYAITHHVPTTPKGVCVCVCWGGGEGLGEERRGIGSMQLIPAESNKAVGFRV
jgi:hypothetical protein